MNYKKYKAVNKFMDGTSQNIGTKQQIVMYLTSIGGTGKSPVCKAIQEYSLILKFNANLRIVAYIANAAILIGGSTIHSSIGLLIDKNVDIQ